MLILIILAVIVVGVIMGIKGIKNMGNIIDTRQHVDWVTRVNPDRGKPPPARRIDPRISPESIKAQDQRVEAEWSTVRRYVERRVQKAETRALNAQRRGKETLHHDRAIRKARKAKEAVDNSVDWEKSFTSRILGTHSLSSSGKVSSGFQRSSHKPGAPPLVGGKKTVSGTLRKVIIGGTGSQSTGGKK